MRPAEKMTEISDEKCFPGIRLSSANTRNTKDFVFSQCQYKVPSLLFAITVFTTNGQNFPFKKINFWAKKEK